MTQTPLSGTFTRGVHVYPLRVYYEDTDAGGIVYHSVYLNFAERARTEMVRLLGIEHVRLKQDEGIVFAVRKVTCDYLRPAVLDDVLEVRTRMTHLGGASMAGEQVIHRPADQTELARIVITLVCMRPSDGRAVRLPQRLRDKVAGLMSEAEQVN